MSTNEFPDLYALIGVEPDATDEEIRTACQKVERERQRDRTRPHEEAASIALAERVLTDPASRAVYDAVYRIDRVISTNPSDLQACVSAFTSIDLTRDMQALPDELRHRADDVLERADAILGHHAGQHGAARQEVGRPEAEIEYLTWVSENQAIFLESLTNPLPPEVLHELAYGSTPDGLSETGMAEYSRLVERERSKWVAVRSGLESMRHPENVARELDHGYQLYRLFRSCDDLYESVEELRGLTGSELRFHRDVVALLREITDTFNRFQAAAGRAYSMHTSEYMTARLATIDARIGDQGRNKSRPGSSSSPRQQTTKCRKCGQPAIISSNYCWRHSSESHRAKALVAAQPDGCVVVTKRGHLCRNRRLAVGATCSRHTASVHPPPRSKTSVTPAEHETGDWLCAQCNRRPRLIGGTLCWTHADDLERDQAQEKAGHGNCPSLTLKGVPCRAAKLPGHFLCLAHVSSVEEGARSSTETPGTFSPSMRQVGVAILTLAVPIYFASPGAALLIAVVGLIMLTTRRK